jgi:intracellular septation protein A
MLITMGRRHSGPGSPPPAAGPGSGSTQPAAQPAAPGPGASQSAQPARPDIAAALRPLLIDVAAPLAAYFVLRTGCGLSLWASLALSSVIPAVRTIAGLAAERRLNLLAVLMLVVNLAGIAVSFWTGDPRMLIAKDAVISSVIALAILGSVAWRRPLMTAGLKPFVTRGDPGRAAAWDRLRGRSARFRRLEALFSVIWGVALLADCVARLIGAFVLPVATMAWLGTVFIAGAIGLASMICGAAVRPMEKMVLAEAA